MWRQIGGLHLVGDRDSSRARTALVAWEKAQSGGTVRHSADIVAATAAPITNLEVLVLLKPTGPDIKAALGVLDRRGLPRWAVVPPAPEDVLSPEFASDEWEALMLARSMRTAVTVLTLRRENMRLRGDLSTIGRRLAHDLRTPLTSISYANEALAAPAIGADSSAVLRQSISAAVSEAGDLIGRVGKVFLASARPVALQPVDMEEIVWNARQCLDAHVRSSGATIISCDRWPEVTGEPSFLELVWTNLLLNSLQQAGTAPRIEIGWERADVQTRFWIRDSGPGVDPTKRAQLFHPLDRLNELNAPRQYGLSLVQRLVELQFGTTGYDGAPKPGGTFFFTLPS